MRVTARVNIDLTKATNYLPMGYWSASTDYYLSDLGIPFVKRSDGSTLGYSVFSLNVEQATKGSWIASEWRLIESAEFIFMQNAYIERLQFESARGGGFEIASGQFQSIAKNAFNVPGMTLNGLNGSGHLASRKIRWNSQGDITLEGGVISPFVDLKGNPALLGGAENTPVNMFRFARTIETSPAYNYTLKCIKELGGMTLRVHNISNRGSSIDINSEIANGFYEEGTSFTTLTLAIGYAVEMICVADSVGFHSWDIIKRYRCRPYTV